jgi:hypothetical protein
LESEVGPEKEKCPFSTNMRRKRIKQKPCNALHSYSDKSKEGRDPRNSGKDLERRKGRRRRAWW